MYIISIILIGLIFIQISVLHRRIKWGWSYNIAPRIQIDQIIYALEVLENSGIGGYLYLSANKNPIRIYIVKNQNDKIWWFELFIKKNHKNILKIFDEKFDLIDPIYNEISGVYNNKSFDGFNKYFIGSDTTAISEYLKYFFINHLQCRVDTKLFLKYYNVKVESGLKLD